MKKIINSATVLFLCMFAFSVLSACDSGGTSTDVESSEDEMPLYVSGTLEYSVAPDVAYLCDITVESYFDDVLYKTETVGEKHQEIVFYTIDYPTNQKFTSKLVVKPKSNINELLTKDSYNLVGLKGQTLFAVELKAEDSKGVNHGSLKTSNMPHNAPNVPKAEVVDFIKALPTLYSIDVTYSKEASGDKLNFFEHIYL